MTRVGLTPPAPASALRVPAGLRGAAESAAAGCPAASVLADAASLRAPPTGCGRRRKRAPAAGGADGARRRGLLEARRTPTRRRGTRAAPPRRTAASEPVTLGSASRAAEAARTWRRLRG